MSETSHQLGDLSDMADGEIRAFGDIGPKGIVVCRARGSLYAVENQCSHARIPLESGRLRGTTLTCPLHGAQFDVTDGSTLGPPALTGIPCHRVDETDDGVVVHIAATATTPEPDPMSGPMFR